MKRRDVERIIETEVEACAEELLDDEGYLDAHECTKLADSIVRTLEKLGVLKL